MVSILTRTMNYYMISSQCAIKLEYTTPFRFNYSHKINKNSIFVLVFGTVQGLSNILDYVMRACRRNCDRTLPN